MEFRGSKFLPYLLLATLCLPFCDLKSVHYIPKLSEFHATPITSYWTSNLFFQSSQITVTHAWTRVWYCYGIVKTLAVNTAANKCARDSPTLNMVLSRLSSLQRTGWMKTVFLQFDLEACQNIDLVLDQLQFNNYASAWLGMRLVKGPKSKIATATSKRCISYEVVQTAQVSILMFDEHPLAAAGETNPGYTEAQLRALRAFFDNSVAHFVALDAMYLSATRPEHLTQHLKDVRIIVYQLEGQQLPNLALLRHRYTHLVGIARDKRVDVMLPKKVVQRMHSYLPIVDWIQRPAYWQNSIPNPPTFYEYMAEPGRPLVHLRVFTRDDHNYVNEKANTPMLSVTLERALQYTSAQRTMLFEFQQPHNHHKYTNFSAYAAPTPAFVLLRAAKGPNLVAGTPPLVDINALTVTQGVTYVVGFQERRGSRWRYTEEEVDGLVQVMSHFKLRNRTLGVYLSAEFLAGHKGVEEFKKLVALDNFKYLFLRAGLIVSGKWAPSDDRVRYLKWNVRKLNRETILHTDWPMRQKMYRWEEIPDPVATTTTTTTKRTTTTTKTTPRWNDTHVTGVTPDLPPPMRVGRDK